MTVKATFPHVVIRASAGTGKTYQLAVRFIGLLAAGARPEEILATTFTRKAAGEILDRVLFWLASAASDDQERAQLAKAIGVKSLTRDECRDLLIATIRRLHALRIGTLDSYFLQVATSFGQELGLPPGWSICDELMDSQLREEAIEQVLSRGRLADLLTLVHSLTKGAAARSVARLVRDTVSGLFELYRETEPAAWTEIAVGKGLDERELEVALQAIAALSIGDKRMEGARREDLERFRAGNWEGFIDKGLTAKVLSGECAFYKKPLPPELIKLYEQLLAHVKSILLAQVARQTEATQQLLARFAEHYHVLQLDERALRFSDVTFRLAQAASVVGPERLAFRLDGGIRHVLFDEFQDTAPAQWRVLRPLAQSVTAQNGGSFFCVGDAKQAIYGWRGGVAEIFDALGGQLQGLGSLTLDQSYRSAPPVIDAVNAVFQNLTSHLNLDKLTEPIRRWQAAFPPHSTARQDLAGQVTLTTAPETADDEPQTDVTFRYAATRIRDCVALAPQASIGVLVRTNAAVGRLIYELRSLGIPASEEGGNPLVDSPAVELILSVLKLADHPADSVARFHLATSPLGELIGIHDYRHDAAVSRFGQQARRQLLHEGYGATLFAFARRLTPSCDARDLSRLQQLVELAYEYQPTSTLRTSDFIRLVETRRIADPQSADVRVMTIHQAKGLQFDVVFLPELEAKLKGQPDRFVAGRPSPTEMVNIVCRSANEAVRQFFPASLQKLFEDDASLEVSESLCVLYVAMTRAVHALHMIVAPARANEKSLPKTFAGLLRATLAPGQPAAGGRTLYEHGNVKWFPSVVGTLRVPSEVSRQPESDGTPTHSVGAQVPTTIKLAPPARHRERGLERTSPSALEGGSRLSATSVLTARAEQAFGVGTLIHAWLEQIEWLKAGVPSDEDLRQIATRLRSEIGDVSKQLDAHIARFRQQLAAPPISAVLSPQYYESPANLGLTGFKSKAWPGGPPELTVHREKPFAIRTGDELLTGSIDRLVVIKAGGQIVAADVIDFKTDELPVGDAAALQQKVEFYRPQIDAYRAAAATLLRLEAGHVALRLVFLAIGRVQPL
jgi:ATP-dependent helicase/nuclease subunit A